VRPIPLADYITLLEEKRRGKGRRGQGREEEERTGKRRGG
jgi:hypothetical protein